MSLKGFQHSSLGMTLIKLLDSDRYYHLKEIRQTSRRQAALLAFNGTLRMPEPHASAQPVFKHSGNAGDVIYALPSVKAICGEGTGELRLVLDKPNCTNHLRSLHPLGGVMLNQHMFERLQPLLEVQPYLASVGILGEEKVDYDLDQFRSSPIPQDRLGISRWYFYHLGVTADLSRPWIEVPGDPSYSGTVLVARSMRYRNLCLDYRFLDRVPDLVFCGTEDEFQDMRKALPRLEYAPVSDFLQLANRIRSCRLFIGNQSFPFALAEAMKVRRVLELDPSTPNVVPCGGIGHDILFQSQFEHVVGSLLGDDSKID